MLPFWAGVNGRDCVGRRYDAVEGVVGAERGEGVGLYQHLPCMRMRTNDGDAFPCRQGEELVVVAEEDYGLLGGLLPSFHYSHNVTNLSNISNMSRYLYGTTHM